MDRGLATRDCGRVAGFTLIELLVAIALMVILLSSITLIFVNTTETVAISSARTTVYTNARYALDRMEADLLGCMPFLSYQVGQPAKPVGQRFIMINGRANPAKGKAQMPTMASGGNHFSTKDTGGAADKLIFRTTTAVGDTTQTVEVSYELIPGSGVLTAPGVSTLDGPPAVGAGDDDRGSTVLPYERPLYTLVRRVRTVNPTDPTEYNQVAKSAPPALADVPDSELCFFVLSFNLEYFAGDGSMSQLDATSPFSLTDPLGDGLGDNDGQNDPPGGPTKAIRVPYIRVTLVIVEDVAARQERQIQKTIWIPVG